jgi:hypothetical protein
VPYFSWWNNSGITAMTYFPKMKKLIAVRAAQGRLSALGVFLCKSVFDGAFCMGAQGAYRAKTVVSGPGRSRRLRVWAAACVSTSISTPVSADTGVLSRSAFAQWLFRCGILLTRKHRPFRHPRS